MERSDLVTFDEAVLQSFFRFMRERHNIFERRFIRGEAPPWTTDPVLANYKYTNVYRELDRGTIWLQRRVLETDDLDQMEKLFWVMAYRIGFSPDTFDGFWSLYGRSVDEQTLSNLVIYLSNCRGGIWTDAYTVTPVQYAGSHKKYENIVSGILLQLRPRLQYLIDQMMAAENLKQCHIIIQSSLGFGDFLAYEVVCDLMYPGGLLWGRFTEDDWVNVGPGAKRGLNYMITHRNGMSYAEIIKILKDGQDGYFARFGIVPIVWNGKKLTLRCIEHALCEFSKYQRIQIGEGTTRRFKPTKKELGL